MGCDIHLHTEIKVDGVWYHYNTANMRRDYELFGFLAGVRYGPENDTSLAADRGLPADVSFVTKLISDDWGCDAHSHSFLDAAEIVILEQWIKENRTSPDKYAWPEQQWGYLFGNSWGDFTKYPNERPKNIEDVRFVFWFDN